MSDPEVEHFPYTMPDGTRYRAMVCRTISGHWVGDVWDEQRRRVCWKEAEPWTDRAGLVRRCTEEVDREFRRRNKTA